MPAMRSGRRQRQGGFARTALADNGQAFPGDDLEIDGFQRGAGLSVRAIGDGQAGEASQHLAHAAALRFASTSANPSEKR